VFGASARWRGGVGGGRRPDPALCVSLEESGAEPGEWGWGGGRGPEELIVNILLIIK